MKFSYTYHSLPKNRLLQKRQTRASLIDTAYDLFSQRGFLNTRMADIALAANVSHGTLFAHFKTQEKLLSEVIETYGGQLALHMYEVAANCIHMEDILSSHLAGIYEFEPFYARLAAEAPFLPPIARDVWIGIQSAISFHFGQVAEREILAGRCADMPTWILFNTWIGLLHHYLTNADLFAPDGSVIERYSSDLVKYFIRMIQANFAAGDDSEDYCACCARPDDSLRPYPKNREDTAEFLIRTQGLDKDAAHEMAIRTLNRLSGWANQK